MEDLPSCGKCGSDEYVDEDGGGSYSGPPHFTWWCGDCQHEIDKDGDCVYSVIYPGKDCYTCTTDDDDWVPSCGKCGDRNDVISGESEDWWWCEHCQHDINRDGDCETNDCSTCNSDDDAGTYCPTCTKEIHPKYSDEDGLFWCNEDDCPDGLFRDAHIAEYMENYLSISTNGGGQYWRYVDYPDYDKYK